MRALLKRLLRPLIHKLDGRFCRLVEATVRPVVAAELERAITPALDAARVELRDSCARTEDLVAYLRRSAQENTLLLDSLVRELVRLQMQLEPLEAMTYEQATQEGP
jgi:hypothetical protein